MNAGCFQLLNIAPKFLVSHYYPTRYFYTLFYTERRYFRPFPSEMAPRGEQSPHKGHFYKSAMTDEKMFGSRRGADVTDHTWISAWVCHKWFSKTGFNLYFTQLLTNFILLNFFLSFEIVVRCHSVYAS